MLGNGGGARGATAGFSFEKWPTHAAAQTVYAVAAGVTTVVTGGNVVAGGVVWYLLQAIFAVPVETASNVIDYGLGIAAGARTELI